MERKQYLKKRGSNLKGRKNNSKILPRLELNKDTNLWIKRGLQTSMKNENHHIKPILGNFITAKIRGKC